MPISDSANPFDERIALSSNGLQETPAASALSR